MTRINVLLIVASYFFLVTGCENSESKDWTEEVFLIVSSEFVDYYPIEGNGVASNGLHIKEDNANNWIKIPLNAIEDFNYEVGHEYRLKVLNTHLANPPADGSDIKYKLLEIILKSEH
jgi:hypothetical protein